MKDFLIFQPDLSHRDFGQTGTAFAISLAGAVKIESLQRVREFQTNER
jgi:hypothetical protein